MDFDVDPLKEALAVNDGLIKTAASQLQQNQRLLAMLDEQMVKQDKIKLILQGDLVPLAKLANIKQVLNH